MKTLFNLASSVLSGLIKSLANSKRWVSYSVKPPQKQGLPPLPVLFVFSRKMKQQIWKRGIREQHGPAPTSSRALSRAASTYGVEVRHWMTQNCTGQKKKDFPGGTVDKNLSAETGPGLDPGRGRSQAPRGNSHRDTSTESHLH